MDVIRDFVEEVKHKGEGDEIRNNRCNAQSGCIQNR
jgi:hypothetical protein